MRLPARSRRRSDRRARRMMLDRRPSGQRSENVRRIQDVTLGSCSTTRGADATAATGVRAVRPTRATGAPSTRPPAPGTRRACVHVDQDDGRCVKYCTNPIAACPASTRTSTPAARTVASRRAGRAQREPRRHGQADQQHDQVGVQLRDHRRVQAGPVRLLVAGVRAAAGDDRAGGQHRRRRPDDHPGEPLHRRVARARRRGSVGSGSTARTRRR